MKTTCLMFLCSFIMAVSFQANAYELLEEGTIYTDKGSIEFFAYDTAITSQQECHHHPEDDSECWDYLEIDPSDLELQKIVKKKTAQGFEADLRQVLYWNSHSEDYWPSSDKGVMFIYHAKGFNSSAALANAINEIVNKYVYQK